MFTGLVQALGIVINSVETDAGRRICVSLAELVEARIGAGDSICVSGVCLTVVEKHNGNVKLNVVGETLRRTTLGEKRPADRVNLELSLRPDSYVGGHFVQGHVDGVAKVMKVQSKSDDWRISFEIPDGMEKLIVPKGSVTVDGVSMTVADAGEGAFSVAVIPTTLECTTLSGLMEGDKVNVETDILNRTVVHWLEAQQGKEKGGLFDKLLASAGVSVTKLTENGFA